jgi:hypothetical protein
VGDPKEGKAYAEGYQDGLEGTPDKYSRMSGLRTGTTQTIMVSIRLHMNEGYWDGAQASGSYGPPPEYPGVRSSVGKGVEEQEEQEDGEKPDEEAQYQDELGRYVYLKNRVKEWRRLRALGIRDPGWSYDPDNTDGLTEEERQEYEHLFERFGGTDPDPELPPGPSEIYEEEDGEEGEAE